MAFKISSSILSAAATGLVVGALAGCGGSTPPPETPVAGSEAPAVDANSEAMPSADMGTADGAPAAAAAGGKSCCKGMNECKAKGGCRAGEHSCKGQNECKGKGGCNAHCPK
jgi:hypothetical protein